MMENIQDNNYGLKIEVVHAKDYGSKSKSLENDGLYIYCGHSGRFENPFESKGDLKREIAVEKFEQQAFPHDEVNRLIGYCKEKNIHVLKLGCYCTSGPCHCNSIKSFIEKNMSPYVLKFKELKFHDGFNLIVRLNEGAPDLSIGQSVQLKAGDEVRDAVIREVLHINFHQLKNKYNPYLEKHCNEELRTYSSLLQSMNGFYKRNIEKSKIVLIFFKVNQ